MTRGTVKVRLRPIKLAFLVNPEDKESLLKAIEINTFLWGGLYNPIIPTYRRIPAKWKEGPFKNTDVQSVEAELAKALLEIEQLRSKFDS